MALEERPAHSAGTDGRVSSSIPNSRSTPSRPSPHRERRATSSRSGGQQSGDGSEFPRYLMQLSHDNKRSRAYELIQELQIMVCNKDTGMKGNSTRARAMVLLKEVQGVLIGLENKLDAQTFDLGVAAVERSELRKELRDEKAKEVAPFHTVDFRSTEVRELPHKLRTLFEDNQLLREQVRQLQYSVRSAEAKLEAAQRRNGALELEVAGLSVALRDAGASADMAAEMRRLRDTARSAEARSLQLEGQVVSLLQQMEADRQAATLAARHAAARQASLEEKLRMALGLVATGRVVPAGNAGGGGGGGGGPGRRKSSSARSGLTELAWEVGTAATAASTAAAATGGEEDAGRAAGGSVRALEYGVPEYLLDAADTAFGASTAAVAAADGTGAGISSGISGGISGAISGAISGGISGGFIAPSEPRTSAKYARQSAYSAASSVAGGGVGAASSRGRLSSGRDHSPPSPPRSPVGRSLSHSPGSSIPALYPLFNAKPRHTHAFSADSSTWQSPAQSLGGGGSSFTGGVGGGGGSYVDGGNSSAGQVVTPLHLPPPPHVQREFSGTGSPRGSSGSGGGGSGGGGIGGAGGSGGAAAVAAAAGNSSRPQSGNHYGAHQGPGLEVLQEGRGGRSPSVLSTASREGTGAAEQVRAINSTAVVTSRTLLPSVSGSSVGGVSAVGAAGAATGGSGGGNGSGGGSARSSGMGILSLRVSLGTGSGSTGSGVRRSSGCGGGVGGLALQGISPEPTEEGGGARTERRESARDGSFGLSAIAGAGAGADVSGPVSRTSYTSVTDKRDSGTGLVAPGQGAPAAGAWG